jgi:hypothetical protein
MRNIDDWPYPLVDELWKAGDKSWIEVSERIYWDQLEVLPPAAMTRVAFAVGEPWNHDGEGAVHTMYIEVGGRFFCRNDHLRDFDPAEYAVQVIDQFGL